MYKNTTAPMIAMLGCLEVNTKISNIDVKTVGSNNYKEVLEDNRDTNCILVVILERARFFCKNGWKFINLFAQSINRLYQVSQLYPRIKELKSDIEVQSHTVTSREGHRQSRNFRDSTV